MRLKNVLKTHSVPQKRVRFRNRWFKITTVVYFQLVTFSIVKHHFVTL
jgi:hypothetical protein